MADDTSQTAESNPESEGVSTAAPGARKVSREFVGIIVFVVLIALGAVGFKGWQNMQSAPDLNYSMDFIKANLELPSAPHLERAAMNGQVAAFYKENGPVQSVVSQKIDSKGRDPFGDPIVVTKTEVNTRNGPVTVKIRVKTHQGERSIVSMVYAPES